MRISRAIRAAAGVAVAVATPAAPPVPPQGVAGTGDPFANHALGLS